MGSFIVRMHVPLMTLIWAGQLNSYMGRTAELLYGQASFIVRMRKGLPSIASVDKGGLGGARRLCARPRRLWGRGWDGAIGVGWAMAPSHLARCDVDSDRKLSVRDACERKMLNRTADAEFRCDGG